MILFHLLFICCLFVCLFVCRVWKSVENYYVKKKLTKERDISPGPGQYNNVLKSNSYTPLHHPLAVKYKEYHASPGKNGYSFNKKKKDTSIL